MCRHLAYVGPPTTLAALLLDPPHGLLHQSYAPVDMRCDARVNADGFGAGWYPPPAVREPAVAQPARYRSDRPMWTDTGFAALAAVTVGTAVLAAVRAATVGMPVTTTGAAPFAEERWLFSHNGVVFGWPDSLTGLAATLPVRDLLTLDAPSDAALLWALVRHRLRQRDDPAAALVDTVLAAQAAAPGSRINLLLTDGATVWATTWTHSLWVRAAGDAVTVSSEPTDGAPGWEEVPDRHLLVATPARCELRPLAPAARTA